MDKQVQLPTFVDLGDSEAIATGFIERKLKLTPPAHIIFVAALFNYVCVNLHPRIFAARIPQIFAGVLGRVWLNIEDAAQLNDRQCENLGTFVGRFLRTIQYVFLVNCSHLHCAELYLVSCYH